MKETSSQVLQISPGFFSSSRCFSGSKVLIALSILQAFAYIAYTGLSMYACVPYISFSLFFAFRSFSLKSPRLLSNWALNHLISTTGFGIRQICVLSLFLLCHGSLWWTRLLLSPALVFSLPSILPRYVKP